MRLIQRPFYILLGIGILLLAGCNRHTVNIKEMSPEQQFEHAKSEFDKKNYGQAKLEFAVIVMNNPGHIIIEQAQFYLAESHFYEKEYILAIEEYEKLIRSIPQSELVDNARYKIGLAYFDLAPNYHLDQEYTKKAILQFQTFLEEYPQSDIRPEVEAKLAEAINKLATKEFKSGELYRKMGYHRAALISFEAVIKNYPTSAVAEEALFWKAESHRAMGNLEDAEATFQEFLRQYKESPLRSKAEKRLKEIEDVLAKYTIKE